MQKIKIYLILLSVLLILGLCSLIFVVNMFAPDKLSFISLFYFLIALITFSSTTLAGFYFRKLFGQREMLSNYAIVSARQGVWFGLILVVSLWMLHQGLFTWVNAGLMVFTFIFFESYLLTKDRNPYEGES